MAEITPDIGLDLFLADVLGATLYLGLFTSQTPTTVPARGATGGAVPTGWTEIVATSGTYARVAIAAGDWGAPATNLNGRRVVMSAAKVVSGFVAALPANGYFIATHPSSQAGDTILTFGNFDSGLARSFNAVTDELRLTPRFQFDG